ncbi:hypothetical protein AVEN_132327-1 [Araneus ventricosus]|uniref:Uncharacterized protein n=1 Tax=Araneus ventricosus TaxID=182803 RepID=A0A4Y2E9W7_ARAVE|nr:hypothetical protein AVEN_132327-1 [Araneus ventricosus]
MSAESELKQDGPSSSLNFNRKRSTSYESELSGQEGSNLSLNFGTGRIYVPKESESSLQEGPCLLNVEIGTGKGSNVLIFELHLGKIQCLRVWNFGTAEGSTSL